MFQARRWLRRLRLPWLKRSSDERQLVGEAGERLAAQHLRRSGYRIIARRFENVAGQIDLIASKGAELVFVEVKTRTGDEPPADGIPVRSDQRDRIERAARLFMRHPAARDRPARFDVITVALPDGAPPRVEHVEDAWRPRYR